MPTYCAYYDASGQESDSSQPLVIAGLVATDEAWRKV
jgi:hypothetical protein